jgi:CRP/FNR family transcriptional regulator
MSVARLSKSESVSEPAPGSLAEANRCELCPTRGACIAAHADAGQLRLLPRYLSCIDSFTSGDHLFHAGDVAASQFHIRSGMVKTYMINAEGDEFVTGFYLPGEIVGQVHVDGGHAGSAVALETVSVCELDDDALESCAQIGLTTALMKQLASNASIDMRHQINLKQTSAQSRFAGYCVLLATRLQHLGRCPTHLPTPMSRTDIASYLGMTLESLSRVISKLHAAQVIRASRDHIEVLQVETINTLGLHVKH